MLGVQSFKLWHTVTTYMWYPYTFNNLFWSLWSGWYEFCCKMLFVLHLSKISDGLVRHVEILFQTCVWNCIEWLWIWTQLNCWCIWLSSEWIPLYWLLGTILPLLRVSSLVCMDACTLVHQVRKTNFHELQNSSCVPGLYGSKLVAH